MARKQGVLTALAVTVILAVSAGGAHVIGSSPVQADASAPATVQLKLANRSRLGEPVYVYVLGTSQSGQQGWSDAGGAFHAWPTAAGFTPTDAPDASIPGPRHGQAMTLQLPRMSGRVYFSYGTKLVFKLTAGGLVQPAPQNPSDPNRSTLFNWAEYTLNDGGLWLNSTQVDMFSAPYAVGLKRADGSIVKTGRLKPGGYRGVFESMKNQPGDWTNLIQTRPDGTPLRVLSPGHGVTSQVLPGNVMDGYIEQVWRKYTDTPLTVTPFSDRPETKFYGTVSGDSMEFKDGSGNVVTSFARPDSDSVFNCHQVLDAPNDAVRGPISRTLCAGFNRGTLLEGSPGGSGNPYVQHVHAQMVDGKAYAFAFDDVGNHEPLVHDANPQRAYLTLDPLD
ncbi:beta-1,3-glucanase family protein [Streptomyces zaomyceticus]|uniref:beta-1,3-glucanase family protein n=1 Tax=Streptomyces zaomyceticus TaxID=68286 RepID=UPI00367D2F00